MKSIITSFVLLFSFTTFAASGVGAVAVVLEQTEVERLESDLRRDGFTLSKIVDVFATRGVAPRCPCTSLDLTFSRVSGGKATEKTFNVYAKGFGNSLQVSIKPAK